MKYMSKYLTLHRQARLFAAGALLLAGSALAGCDLGAPSAAPTPAIPASSASSTPAVLAQAQPTQPATILPTYTPADTATVQAAAQAVPPTETLALPTATSKPIEQPTNPPTVAVQPTRVPAQAPTHTSIIPTATHRPAATPTNVRPTATHVPTHTAAPQATATAVPPAATKAPTQVPAAVPAAPTATAKKTSGSPQVQLIANGFGNPDDLVIDPAGNILFGDFTNKSVNIIRPGQSPQAIGAGFTEPEGLVVAKDGALIVVEQSTNRIYELNPATGEKKLLRQLVNNTGQDGVDGIGLDPNTGDILIADSPNGKLLRMSRDGTTLTTIATGFVRPTDAEVEASGSIIVVDEFGNAVYRVRANGTRVKLASMYQPDDVVIGPDGSLYVNGLAGDIVKINPTSGAKTVLISGLKLPHGIGLDASGNIIIAEAGRNRIFKLVLNGQ